MNTTLSPYELLDLIASQQHIINDTWTFFVTVHLALLGGLIFIRRSLHPVERLVAVLGYLAFIVINHQIQSQNYAVLNQLMTETKGLAAPGAGKLVLGFYADHGIEAWTDYILYIYVAAALFSSLSLLFINHTQKRIARSMED